MVLCRFFQQGCCRYGDSCRFEHSYLQKYSYHAPETTNTNANNITVEQLLNQIVPEINVALKSKQWLMSCYGPFKNKPNFPGFHDVSPDEVRLSTYEAQSNGTLADNLNQLRNCQQNILKNLQALIKPSASIINTIQNLYRGEPTSDPFDPPSQANFMNNRVHYDSRTTTNTNIFGDAIQSAKANNIFAAGQSSFQNSLDNVTGTAATSSAFAFNTNNMFASQTGAVQNNNVFGDAQFNSVNTVSPIFPTSAQNNIFSTNQNDNTSAMFGVTSNPTNFELGQLVKSEVSPSALFASANAELHQAGNVQEDVFKINSAKVGENPFEIPSSNVFGVNKVSNQTFVNEGSSQFDNEEVYSNIENITPDDLRSFKKSSFEHGYIPEIAPPLSLCSN